MNRTQQAWAATHDWFICKVAGGVMVKDEWLGVNGWESEALVFTCVKELKAWAGY